MCDRPGDGLDSEGDVDWQYLENASKTCVQTRNALTD